MQVTRHRGRRALRGARSTSTSATLRLQGCGRAPTARTSPSGSRTSFPAAAASPTRRRWRRSTSCVDGRGHDRHRGRRRRRSARYDSCYLAPNEARSIENRTNRPASMLVVMPYPPGGRRARARSSSSTSAGARRSSPARPVRSARAAARALAAAGAQADARRRQRRQARGARSRSCATPDAVSSSPGAPTREADADGDGRRRGRAHGAPRPRRHRRRGQQGRR